MAIYPERYSGLPSSRDRRTEPKQDPFQRELSALAKVPGIEKSFLSALESYTPNSNDVTKMTELLDWGRRYHSLDLSDVFAKTVLEDTKEVGVYVPAIKVNGEGLKSVSVPPGSPQLMASLLGIIGAGKLDALGNVVFDGVVVLRSMNFEQRNALLVGINSRSGQMHFHPDFLPEGDRSKTIDVVIPQFRLAA